jgi:RNA polymerase-binding transcription factor DksA
MAKKNNAKPTKKVAAKKPVKKAAVKKVATKAPAKSSNPKKPVARKPLPAAKKPAKKAKTAVKTVGKPKPVKKPVAKTAKKPASGSPKTAVTKPAAAKSQKKTVTKPLPVKALAVKPTAPVKPAPVAKKPMPAKETPVKAATVHATVPESPKKKGRAARSAASAEPKAASKPLVTQGTGPNMPRVTPMVKKQVSTLEAGDKERYSDHELEEFRAIINVKLEEARKDYDLLKQTLANTDNNGTEDTSPSFKMIEDGSETLGREETAQLAGRQEKFIKHLEDALLRIRNKTYGICRVTGKLISKERLRLVPHATLSIEAKQQMSS